MAHSNDIGLYYSQAYQSAYRYYFDALKNETMPLWDYVFITASSKKQKEVFEKQINIRKEYLPKRTKFIVISDKDDVRVGSGGSTLMVIHHLNKIVGIKNIDNLKILVIHSGGDAQRIPQYSVPGKLFAPMPHELPNKRPSTLFDEIFITSARIASRIRNGMVLLSGDVLLLFNPLFINCYQDSAYAVAFQEKPKIAAKHGVYVGDSNDYVTNFLHKENEETFKKQKAYNDNGTVNIDTGLIIFSPSIIKSLFKLIDTEKKYNVVVSNYVRLSLYGDLIYPLAKNSTLQNFYREKAEGEINKDLISTRQKIWNLLHGYKLKLLKIKPGKFLHFGTSQELLNFYINLKDYKSLGWLNNTHSCNQQKCFCYNSYVSPKAKVGKHCYFENSIVNSDAVIGDNVILSNVEINDEIIPSSVVLSGLKLNNNSYVVRIYNINDNPKMPVQKNAKLTLWEQPLYPVCHDMRSALDHALSLYQKNNNVTSPLISLRKSFENADVEAYIKSAQKTFDYVDLYYVLSLVKQSIDISKYHTDRKISFNKNHEVLLERLKGKIDDMSMIRLYLYLAKYVDKTNQQLLIDKSFKYLSSVIVKNSSLAIKRITLKTNKSKAIVRLPLRVNFAGGWTDTPPYCYEHGGAVTNAPVLLQNQLPVYVEIKKIPQRKIIIESSDINSYKEFSTLNELQTIGDPYDNFVLHKCCLIVAGVIPRKGGNLSQIINQLKSGMYIKTKIINVPKGSGLGTSSILCLGLLKCLYKFFNHQRSQSDLLDDVLLTEQLMSTGGGWQDQAGGVCPGFKLVTSSPGYSQKLKIQTIKLSSKTIKELNNRFVLVYTGQRRLAKNILRNVMSGYLENNNKKVKGFNHIKNIAYRFKDALEKGNLDLVAKLMNEQWEYSKIINQEASNSLIENIFMKIKDLISGKMICGAGGGGFLQVLLKKNVSKSKLEARLSKFKDLNILMYNVNFYLNGIDKYENN